MVTKTTRVAIPESVLDEASNGLIKDLKKQVASLTRKVHQLDDLMAEKDRINRVAKLAASFLEDVHSEFPEWGYF